PVFRGDTVRWDEIGTIPFDALGAPGWNPRQHAGSGGAGASPGRPAAASPAAGSSRAASAPPGANGAASTPRAAGSAGATRPGPARREQHGG
ncbi:MAG: hypothetical protein DLM62_08490, partial [Pseudonocardiales bacterium]